MRSLSRLLGQLNRDLRDRRISEGIALLEGSETVLSKLRASDSGAADFVLCVAQWIDVGYKSPMPLENLLGRFSPDVRSQMPLRHFLFLRMAQAFSALSKEDADTAIELLEFVLKAERELADDWLIVLAHFWKGRAHRKKGEYEIALRDIVAARTHAQAMQADKLAAVIQIQEAWLVFQKGDPKAALALLDRAERQLKSTDDAISLGNIASARGRIVRRTGEYAEALEYYDQAISIYARRDGNHRNLARTLVNSAYVKRLIALQLRKKIDSRSSRATGRDPKGSEYARYMQLCQEALKQLHRAGEIYALHQHHGGAGSVLVNSAHLHLDMGNIDAAVAEGQQAYELGQGTHDHILMARARILAATAENARVEEELGEDADTAVYANNARRYAEEAITLAQQTQNRRLLAAAHIARGIVAANDFFQEWDEARQCESRATPLVRAYDRDHLWEELIALKSRILRSAGINETLRAWSDGVLGGKTFQRVTEEFAEIVIPKVWVREGKKISRVAEKLAISPKKVRRILRNAGLLGMERQPTRRRNV